MKTIEATREVVRSAKQALDVRSLPVDTVFFIFLEAPPVKEDSDDDGVPKVHFIRAKWVASGLIATHETGVAHRLRVRCSPAESDASSNGILTLEPPRQLKAGDILEHHVDDEWHSLLPVIGFHVV